MKTPPAPYFSWAKKCSRDIRLASTALARIFSGAAAWMDSSHCREGTTAPAAMRVPPPPWSVLGIPPPAPAGTPTAVASAGGHRHATPMRRPSKRPLRHERLAPLPEPLLACRHFMHRLL
ncbi:hypothetical protein BS78_K240000 [Paspalum vaginatum]|uniref:Uncharacterized protein n=1 Tax=Paspalum vaginatum TaxID=158149 RepID=A0A9W8CD92_9POAL|nr:hypothetical protein BS78_K240000 [Paspalum vaginatum]